METRIEIATQAFFLFLIFRIFCGKDTAEESILKSTNDGNKNRNRDSSSFLIFKFFEYFAEKHLEKGGRGKKRNWGRGKKRKRNGDTLLISFLYSPALCDCMYSYSSPPVPTLGASGETKHCSSRSVRTE